MPTHPAQTDLSKRDDETAIEWLTRLAREKAAREETASHTADCGWHRGGDCSCAERLRKRLSRYGRDLNGPRGMTAAECRGVLA